MQSKAVKVHLTLLLKLKYLKIKEQYLFIALMIGDLLLFYRVAIVLLFLS